MLNELTWIVLIRDLSQTVRVTGQSSVVACLVLDAGTGMVRGMSAASTGDEACNQAMQLALTMPAGDLPPGRPDRVVSGVGCRQPVVDQLAVLLGNGQVPEVTEVISDEAEDIFDSFVGHMCGRKQPTDCPTPGDWSMLVEQSDAYRRAEPWRNWTDQDHFDFVVRIDGRPARYVMIVLGAEGVQCGLVLYPGGALPESLLDWRAGEPASVPAGSLMFYLDPPVEVPQDFRGKAARYGWPVDAEMAPVWVATDQDGPADLDRTAAQRLTLAIAAVLATDREPSQSGPITGTCVLSSGEQGSFTLRPPY